MHICFLSKAAIFRYRNRLLLLPKCMHIQFTIWSPAKKHQYKRRNKKIFDIKTLILHFTASLFRFHVLQIHVLQLPSR